MIPIQMQKIIISTLFSVSGYLVVNSLIPQLSPFFIKRGLFGKDMSKINNPIIPETLGIVPAIVYLFIMILYIPFLFNNDSNISSFLGSLLSIQSMILLGLLDDLFDIKWRHKFFLPAISSIPLLIVYFKEFNKTSILIPKFLNLNKTSIDLGILYYLYMALVSIFCPNSINILAGINGLEVGQTIIISLLLLLNDIYYLIGLNYNELSYQIHLFSICMIIPFLGISLALFKFNKFPSKCFVGDTWCYFSGMVFANIGISCHYAKTLMLFFLPQIFNFIYSAPQLFGLIKCPRHRLPKFNKDDGLLYNSFTEYSNEDPLNLKFYPILNFLHNLKLIKLIKDNNGKITKISNFTLINLVIIWFGPKVEGDLCSIILKLQFLVGFLMLILRHTLAPYIFGFDNSWNMLNRLYT